MTDTEPDETRVFQGANGDWYWNVRAAGNHEVIAASSEGYVRKADAIANLERVTGRKFSDTWPKSLG